MLDPVLIGILEDLAGGSGGGGSASFDYKGTIATATLLPSSGMKRGDAYYVSSEEIFYVYDGGWKAAGGKAITTAEIDELWP